MKKSVWFLSMLCALGSLSAEEKVKESSLQEKSSAYTAKDYASLLGMKGFGDELLKMHFQLYQGYVKNTNLLLDTLKTLDPSTYAFTALKRRLGWEMDGMRLHELYFDNLGGKTPIDAKSALYKKLEADFGSFDAWKKDFVATGLTRGIGWVVLYKDPQSGRLINMWINEHDVGHLAGGAPLLVMDVFEHAYITQYGLAKQQYIDAFFQNIRWEEASARFKEKKER